MRVTLYVTVTLPWTWLILYLVLVQINRFYQTFGHRSHLNINQHRDIHVWPCTSRYPDNLQRRHLRGTGGRRSPRKKKKRKKKEKRNKRKKEKKGEKRKKGTMTNVRLLHIKCSFSQFSNSPVASKNLDPQEEVEMSQMTPLITWPWTLIILPSRRLDGKAWISRCWFMFISTVLTRSKLETNKTSSIYLH